MVIDSHRVHAKPKAVLPAAEVRGAATWAAAGPGLAPILDTDQILSQGKIVQLVAAPAPARKRTLKASQGAFTFVELLSVLFFLGVLAMVLLPACARARQKSIQISCTANLRQIGAALHLYTQANHDTLPGPVFDLAQPGYDQASNRELSWFLAEQLGYPKPSTDLVVAGELVCPAQSKSASDLVSQRGPASYLVNACLKTSEGSRIYPFGQLSEPGSPPLKLSLLTAYGPPARMKVMADADKANANPTLRGWGELPCRPVHGSVRNQLFFDGHAAD
jgi:prepilin-type processing-associated H-X9-DG protein